MTLCQIGPAALGPFCHWAVFGSARPFKDLANNIDRGVLENKFSL
jgi:hypothetical protein